MRLPPSVLLDGGLRLLGGGEWKAEGGVLRQNSKVENVRSLFGDRKWQDYTYTLKRGHDPMQVKRLTIWFQDDALVRIDGDIKPDPQRAANETKKEIVVSVPDWKDNRGFLTRAMTTK